MTTAGIIRGTMVAALALALPSCASFARNAGKSAEQPQASGKLTSAASISATVVRSTAVAALRQPVTTAKAGVTMLWHRSRELLVGNLPLVPAAEAATGPPPGSPEFEGLLDLAGIPRAEPAKLTFLVDGPEFFPEFERRIREASRSIDSQVFIFDNDDYAVRLAQLLKEKSHTVPVRVLFDDLGTALSHASAPETGAPPGFTPPPDMAAFLSRDSRIDVRRTLNPWLTCDHTKLHVIDGNIAFLGGMNIGREYRSEWHDLMIRVEGPAVRSLAQDFQQSWRKTGPWGDFALFSRGSRIPAVAPVAGPIPVRILRTDPAEGRHEIRDAMLSAIRGARQRVWLQTPYFSHDETSHALAAAARRGVDVRVVIPRSADSAIMEAANAATARRLILSGARVYRYPRMTHMKAMIADSWATAGSANVDLLSLRVNRELNVSFNDPGTVRELERRVFLPDFRKSRAVTLREPSSAGGTLAEFLADQL